MSVEILVLYYSRHGSTLNLARQLARGIESVEGCIAKVRTVKELEGDYPTQDPYVTHEDLKQCDGLALGSPVWFGNMAAPMKHFLDSTSAMWINGDLIDKPSTVFTSSSSLHGGQESCLLSMQLPLLHHGMMILGIPYSEPELHLTQSGGTPYGASSVNTGSKKMEHSEKELANKLGSRLATIAKKLKVKCSH